jgi:DNA polymerase III alpha subunit
MAAQVLHILELARGIPFLIRGSAAGSLVCYLLGITHIDPVKV